MILFFEYGRLGNQLFQYFGLTKFFPNDKLVFVGCESLENCFDSVDARFIHISKVAPLIPYGILKRIVFFLSASRLLGSITESNDLEVFKLIVRRGLFKNIYVAQNVFFQHIDVVKQIQLSLQLNPCLARAALSWLRSKGVNVESGSLVFVHIRRGDYLLWPSQEAPAVLDLAWYKRAIELMQQRIVNPVFVLMSDDHYYVRDFFNESEALIISDNSLDIDFAIMSLCCSGILSPSSFAWWGAFYARSQERQDGVFMAPKYWAGHRSKSWYPAKFYTDWITYIE